MELTKKYDFEIKDIVDMLVILYTPADIVQHAFLVQHSLTPLNLEICQSYIVYDCEREENCPSFTYSKEVISNEEKCRKVLSKSRRLLYALHLDLPRDRERSLRNRSQDMKPSCKLENAQKAKMRIDNDSEISFVAKISIDDDLYADILYSLVTEACKCKRKNGEKYLSWFVEFNPSDKSVVDRLPCAVVGHIFKFENEEKINHEIFNECMRRLKEMKWIITDEPSKPAIFSKILYHLHQNNEKAKPIIRSSSFVDYFISLSSFQLADSILKLKNSPSFCEKLFYSYVDEIFHAKNAVYVRKTTGMSLQRQTLMLQAFWIYLRRSGNPEEGHRFLRLIWKSVSDSFLRFNEIATAFTREFTEAETTDVYNYYLNAVRELCPDAGPRKLEHYLRTVIRRRLSQNGHWLPDGIKELRLPTKLQSYLNLEK